jgi:hypothetical protein
VNTGRYSYKFAPLEEILSTIQPVMGEVGLSVSWEMPKEVTDKVAVDCIISHELGHSERSGLFTIAIASTQENPGPNSAQRTGGAITYAKRYSLLAIIGMAPEDDEDGSPRGESRREGPREEEGREVPGEHALNGRPITEPMRKRYFAIARGAGWSDAQRADLLKKHGVAGEDAITFPDYEKICEALKSGPAVALKDERQGSLA